jgi:hypothetical protein
MNRASCLMGLLLIGAAARAQAPTPPQPVPSPQQPASGTQQTPVQNPYALTTTPVPITAEPHHRLVLHNDFIHVYDVMVPPLDATLLHRHDLPYLYVTLGLADLVNAVVGQPELHMTLQDGETHYNPGHFAHLVRTDAGLPFHNITIELVHPQGTARNLCKEVWPGQPTECAHENASGKKASTESSDDSVPYFETDELRVEVIKVSAGRDYTEQTPKHHALLVALTDSNLDASIAGEHLQFLHSGDVLWMLAGIARRVVDFLGTHSSFLLISFKDSAPRPATQ